jgi:stearoyl-CoA desaturase (Delta-9 desaturase)
VVAILIFFVAHWQISVFFQSFFQHRYAAHKQYTMSKGWERVMYFLTWATQGSSYLNPRAYAILHRMHHAYSDTEQDPHSPRFNKNVFGMMWKTAQRYHNILVGTEKVEPRFLGGYPEWPLIDKIGEHWGSRLAWGALYFLFYVQFATAWWMFLLLPIHWVMGPMHGAIVNWLGHRAGYRNFKSSDDSKNTLPFDFLTAGELFQNNHHEHASRSNFGWKRWEIDPTWQVMKVLALLRIIRLRTGSPRVSSSRPASAEGVVHAARPRRPRALDRARPSSARGHAPRR